MSKLAKADSQYLPEVFDDTQVVAHLRSLVLAAEKKRKHCKRMFYLCGFLFCVTVVSFVVRWWR